MSLVVVAACSKGDAPPTTRVVEPSPPAQAIAPPTEKGRVARGTLRRATVETGYLVIVPRGDLGAIEQLARTRGPTLDIRRFQLADLFDVTRLDVLTQRMSSADAAAVKASVGAIAIGTPGPSPVVLVPTLAAVARDVADAAQGWVVDVATNRVFSAAEFHAHVPRERSDVRDLVVVENIVGDALPSLNTAGMERFGLPELFVIEVPPGEVNQVTHLINAAAQVLIDGGDVNDRGELAIDVRALGWGLSIIEQGTGKAVWKLRWASPPDAPAGAPRGVELTPATGTGPAALAELVEQCFGRPPDAIATLKDDDPELLAAAARARTELVALRPRFAKGALVDEKLSVKAVFRTSDARGEWMWVDVVAFTGDTLEGALASQPTVVTSLRLGDKVRVKLADVADYVHEVKGGATTGGYSIAIARKRGLVQ